MMFALVTTSFGFSVRALLITEWGVHFNLTDSQIGALQGAGLFPFALSIIFFSLFIDRLGYGRAMVFAWSGHVVSAILTITATGYTQLYLGTFLFALSNGVVEAVINPVTATLYPKSKTRHLNLLHMAWPGGLVLGGVLAIMLGGLDWRVKVGLFLVPAAIYGLLMLRCSFPVQERVAAGVSDADMLKEFGWGGCLIVCYFVAHAVDEVVRVFGAHLGGVSTALLTLLPTAAFAWKVRSFGRPLFALLLVLMILLATTELGTDSWVAALMTPILKATGPNAGNWVLVYTSLIMCIMRFYAGSILRYISPLGLLAVCSVLACAGLLWLSSAGSAAAMVFLAATLYGVGKCFLWSTTLGVVAEQFPKGGALTLNAISGMGMIAVGVLGAPLLGTIQDKYFDEALKREDAALHAKVAAAEDSKFGLVFQPLDKQKIAALPAAQQEIVGRVRAHNSQATLAKIAVLPGTMFLAYVGLIIYFRRRGGYKAVELKAASSS
jgi:MFS family permease